MPRGFEPLGDLAERQPLVAKLNDPSDGRKSEESATQP
jgi:hypothetical protein